MCKGVVRITGSDTNKSLSNKHSNMDWGNDVHGPVYPVGNIHLQYFEEVTERFVDGGLEPEDAHIVTVGSDLIGWWLKGQYPEAEVTAVEANPRTSYLQSFAGDYLSDTGTKKSTEQLKGLIGIDDPSTGIPSFVEQDETPQEVMEAHEDYVQRPDTRFDEVPDFPEIGFAWKDFYSGIIDEIGFDTERPDNHIIGDFRDQEIPDADAVYTNNVIDIVGEESFYRGLEDIMKDEAYLEAFSEPGGEALREEFSGLNSEMNPDIGFWWQPSPDEERHQEGYRPQIALYSPEA